MPVKTKRFMVLVLNDCDGCGFDQHTLRILLTILDSASPDHREWLPFHMMGYFLTSVPNLTTVADLIEQVKRPPRLGYPLQ